MCVYLHSCTWKACQWEPECWILWKWRSRWLWTTVWLSGTKLMHLEKQWGLFTAERSLHPHRFILALISSSPGTYTGSDHRDDFEAIPSISQLPLSPCHRHVLGTGCGGGSCPPDLPVCLLLCQGSFIYCHTEQGATHCSWSRCRFSFQHPQDGLQPSPVPGDSAPTSGLYWYQACLQNTSIHAKGSPT